MLDRAAPQDRLDPSPWFAAEILYPVVYADTDAMGIVYHGKYLEMAERSRSATVAAAGVDQKQAQHELGFQPVVNKVNIRYLAPIRLHDVVRLTTGVSKAGSAHVWWRTCFFVEDQLRATVEASTIFIGAESGEIADIPAGLLETMRAVQERS